LGQGRGSQSGRIPGKAETVCRDVKNLAGHDADVLSRRLERMQCVYVSVWRYSSIISSHRTTTLKPFPHRRSKDSTRARNTNGVGEIAALAVTDQDKARTDGKWFGRKVVSLHTICAADGTMPPPYSFHQNLDSQDARQHLRNVK